MEPDMSFSHAMNAPWVPPKAPAAKAIRTLPVRRKLRLRAGMGRFADQNPTLAMFAMLALLAIFVIGLWDVMGWLMPL